MDIDFPSIDLPTIQAEAGFEVSDPRRMNQNRLILSGALPSNSKRTGLGENKTQGGYLSLLISLQISIFIIVCLAGCATSGSLHQGSTRARSEVVTLIVKTKPMSILVDGKWVGIHSRDTVMPGTYKVSMLSPARITDSSGVSGALEGWGLPHFGFANVPGSFTANAGDTVLFVSAGPTTMVGDKGQISYCDGLGCVVVNGAQALSFTPPKGKAGLYLIRPRGIVGAAGPWTVMLDNVEIGGLNVGCFMYKAVSPGLHIIGYPQFKHLELTVEADQNYYLSMKPGWGPSHFMRITEAHGHDAVNNYDLYPAR